MPREALTIFTFALSVGFSAVGFRVVAFVVTLGSLFVRFFLRIRRERGSGSFFFGLLLRENFLSGGSGLDFGFDFVPKVYVGGGIRVVVRVEIVLTAELAEFGRTDVKLMGDPGVCATLAHPGADLIELWA